jgi:HK97 family phage portal protein
MGAALFGNGAMPSLVFKFQQGVQGFKTDEEGKKFIEDFQSIYAKRGRFKGMLLPKGMDVDSFAVENDKAQFLATRQYQRTVIAGAFGVPPHLVGDLSKGTFRNVEEQNRAFIQSVILPYIRIFEGAMERSLLTDEDRRNGVVIRFNLDAALRADFKTRQEGLQIQRQNGIINANAWREQEGMNPISEEDGGEEYWRQGPSGQSATTEPASTEEPAEDDDEDENSDG